MLNNLLNYFARCTKDEGLQAACFNIAAERYLNIKFSGNYSEDQLSLIAIKIAKQVRREFI